MDTSKNDKIIQKLRCGSPSVVYHTLVEIRAKEVNSANGVTLLRKRGALKYLIKLLQRPNEKIIDVTLSILGNCCLENESCLELYRLGAIGPLVRILEDNRKDSIQGRTCRVLANLSQHQEIAAVVCREGVVPILVGILKPTVNDGSSSELNSFSDMTKQMAVRALRVLGENLECRGEIVNRGGVNAVAELISSSDEVLQKAALKALITLTQHCSDECAKQAQGDGACFEYLVSLVEIPDTYDDSSIQKLPSSLTKSALMCISNLARIPGVRPLLGNAGAVNALINQLRYFSKLDFNNEWKQDLLSTLCLFSHESVNRMKLRDYGGLDLLIIELKADKHGPVAAALCNFAYDDNGFRQLIDSGLIHVCVDRLRDIISTKFKENHHCHAYLPYTDIPEEVHKRRNSLQVQKSSPALRSKYRQTSMEDDCHMVYSIFPELKASCFSHGRRKSKCPVKTTSQKTFRISSPSYQAVQHEQEGYRNPSSWSPPSVSHSSPVSVASNDLSGASFASADCNVSGEISTWGGSNSLFGGCFLSQNSVSPMPLSLLSHPFQDGPHSPEASSCSGGSSSSCTSGYASSPRSDLSDAPSPGCSMAIVGTMDEVYSPVYEDGSDDSGQEDHEIKDYRKEDGKIWKGVGILTNKRARYEINGTNQDVGVGKYEKKCMSLLKEKASTSQLTIENAQPSLSGDEKKSDTENILVDEMDKDKSEQKEYQRGTGEEMEKPKNKKTLVDFLFILLSHASQIEEPIEELASYATISVLLDFHLVNLDPLSKASQILSRIVGNEHYLIPLINQRFVMTVRSRFCCTPIHKEQRMLFGSPDKFITKTDLKYKWQKCSECCRLQSFGMSILLDLRKSAESGYGEGELAYGLLKGDSSHRMAIALSLPFIIGSHKRNKLLLGCNGLNILLDILRDYGNIHIKCAEKSTLPENKEDYGGKDEEEDAGILNAAVDGLSCLASDVGMKVVRNNSFSVFETYFHHHNQVRSEESILAQTCVTRREPQPSNKLEDEVVFTLDDGSSVITSRESMSNISPVFQAMLRGNFVESKGISIKLPGVSHNCLSYIMHYMGECQDVSCINHNSDVTHPLAKKLNDSNISCNCCHWAENPKDVRGALELVSIADRFLLPNTFCKTLADQVLEFHLRPESAANIYMWCLGAEGISGSRAPEHLGLLEGAVSYILKGEMMLDERVTVIKSIFSHGFGEELVSHMNDIFRIYFE